MSRQLIRDFIEQETKGITEEVWMSWNQIKESDRYKKIVSNFHYFHDYIDDGYLEGKIHIVGQSKIKRSGRVKQSELEALYNYFNKLECEGYISDIEFLPLLGYKQRIRKYGKRILDQILILLNSENIEFFFGINH